MRKYPLHYLNADEFENLVTVVCTKILGEGVIPFAQGTDGGRDGRFHGKTNDFPSQTKPWEGKTVIQAKLTNKENASCSDSDFTKILNNDVLPAINRLKTVKKINNYLLFTNRKLTGKKDEKIEDLINQNTDINNLVIGNEKIQQWLQAYPEVVRQTKLNDLLRPLQFDERDLKELIVLMSANKTIQKSLDEISDFTYVDMATKNQLNNLNESYFNDVIKRHYSYFDSIRTFLKDPINSECHEKYEDLVDEINAKIVLFRDRYLNFEGLFEELYDHVILNNPELSGKKRLVRTFISYMYCNCDIGKKQ
ncbi:MAG TPA: ABC-three component system protein [Flavobacterium sp.]